MTGSDDINHPAPPARGINPQLEVRVSALEKHLGLDKKIVA